MIFILLKNVVLLLKCLIAVLLSRNVGSIAINGTQFKGMVCACEDLSPFAQVRHVRCLLDGQGLMFSLIALCKHSLQTFVFVVSFKTLRRKFSLMFTLKVHVEFGIHHLKKRRKKALLFIPTRIRVNWFYC